MTQTHPAPATSAATAPVTSIPSAPPHTFPNPHNQSLPSSPPPNGSLQSANVPMSQPPPPNYDDILNDPLLGFLDPLPPSLSRQNLNVSTATTLSGTNPPDYTAMPPPLAQSRVVHRIPVTIFTDVDDIVNLPKKRKQYPNLSQAGDSRN